MDTAGAVDAVVQLGFERKVPPVALLVDFDGVLRRWSADDTSIERHCGLPAGAIRRVAFSPELLKPAITGAVSDEVWREHVVAQLQREHPGSSAREAVVQWSAAPGEVEARVLTLLSRCRPELRLVLCTNATSRLPADLRRLGLANRFYAVANSSELGTTKPSTFYFEAALRLAGVRAYEALFVDDSLLNVQAATAMGMLAHHFTSYEGMSAFLSNAGAFAES